MHRLDNPRWVAIALVALGAVLALGGDRSFPPAAAAQPSANNAEPSDLVAYFLTWHATAKMSHVHEDVRPRQYNEYTQRFVGTMTGSAIVRYRQMRAADLVFFNQYDTRYLVFTLNENRQTVHVRRSDIEDCATTNTHIISDPGSYSGTVVPRTARHPRGSAPSLLIGGPTTVNGVRVMEKSFEGFGDMTFSRRWTVDHAGWAKARYCGINRSSTETRQMFFKQLIRRLDHPLDLLADSTDDSSFSLKTAYTVQDGMMLYEIQWTAHATRMGKCAERKGPIPTDDPIIQNVDVKIKADPSEIQPDGSTNVKVTVTCDQVPIEGAEVELSIKPKANSGYHDHDNKRPGGKLDDHELTDPDQKITVKTEANGSKTVKFEPPGKTPESRNVGIAGLYNVKATLTARFKDRTDDKDITVRFTNLLPLVVSPDTHYEVCGRSKRGCQPPKPGEKPKEGVSAGFGYRGTATHQEGEWGTAGTVRAFTSLGSDLYTVQVQNNELLQRCGKPAWPVRKLSLNDVALPEGGLFDADATWATPHKTHGRGQGGDVNHFYGDGVVIDCYGGKGNLDDWLAFSMLELGTDYGKWDTEMDRGGQLHLHVED